MSSQTEPAFDCPAADATVARYGAAVEARDAAAAAACLTEDAVFHSATTSQYAYTSRAHIQEMMTGTLAEFRNTRCRVQAGEGDTRVVVFSFTLAGVEGEDAQILRFTPDGRIREVTAYVRPLPALAQIPARVAPSIARRAGKKGLARMIAVSSRPIAAMLRSGDASMSPKTDPARNQ